MERLSIDEVIEHCNKTCDMTEKIAKARGHELQSIESKQFWEHYQVREWLKELKKYKDAEEQGLLLRLPCAVDSTVYLIKSNGQIASRKADMQFLGVLWDDYGKEWFLTKEEAKQALAEMKGV